MDNANLNNYGAYKKSIQLFDLVVEDCNKWMSHYESKRLVSQQLASSDSICANIEEGYGRFSKKEYVQFLVYSRGSAQETRGRYKRLKHWIPDEIIQSRIALTSEIIAILSSSIQTLKGKDKS
jgi:four helix bundle protein